MKHSMERLSVFVDDARKPMMMLGDVQIEEGLTKFLQTVRELTDAPTDAVATSVFFRRLGFFLAAQFHAIAVHQQVFAGSLKQVGVIHDEYTFKFTVSSEDFIKVQDSQQALRFVLDTYGHPLVEIFSKHAKISKLILWENIWGYVIWVYNQLLHEGVQSASKDLDFLLLDSTWTPHLRRSPFKQFLQNQSALDAMKDYKRLTCCLLKEMPNTKKCPYCPKAR
ncbi:IucA/IucC family C-terminal-domain containing protein [Paenisporosarcina sp.]|uniref:IucA/IucC family C-terminal-domain containing protein n=1 Tax=Paenisporosarcina sp. TaxID=1932001 RepID=UPI003C763FD2